jgi:hypothetical protein
VRFWLSSSLLFLATAACDSNDPPRAPGGKDASISTDSGTSDAGITRDSGTTPDSGTDGGITSDGGTPSGEELITCPSGQQLVFYSWTPLAQLPAVGDLEFSGLISGTTVLSAGDGETQGIRFDLCRENNGTHHLHGVLWASYDFGWPYYFRRDDSISVPVQDQAEYRGGNLFQQRLPADRIAVTGLDEAVAGDLQALEIRLINDTGLLILGHDTFVAGTHAQVEASSVVYTTLEVVAGGLSAGDIFINRPCPFGETNYSKTFTLNTAQFEVDACTFLGGGHTTGYRINRLAVTDSNAKLSATEQETFTFEGESAVEAVMNYAWNHHNACDSFHLALAHADYAASASPLAGCGLTVPNAPMRSFDEDPVLPVQYRIRYHGGSWTDGDLPGCNHYLFCQ